MVLTEPSLMWMRSEAGGQLPRGGCKDVYCRLVQGQDGTGMSQEMGQECGAKLGLDDQVRVIP